MVRFLFGVVMVYCATCGEKLLENANFCPKCGTRTHTGANVGSVEPKESMRQAFIEAGKELDRAFSIAVEEVKKAFAEAREAPEKAPRVPKGTITCPQCGSSNSSEAEFCSTCGKSVSKTA